MTTATRLKDVPGAGTLDPTTGRTRSGGEYYFSRDGGPAAPAVSLGTSQPAAPLASLIASRKDALTHASFISAQASAAAAGDRDEDRDEWWSRSFGNAEWRNDTGYPKMPDDFTPSGTGGQSVTGNRRTSRRWYKGEDISVRMPSVSAIKRFSRSIDSGTFDLPVQVSNGADGIQGWVRVTQHGQQWSVTGIGMNAADSAGMSEAVRALLESRTPTVELSTVANLRDRYKARVRQEGMQTEQLNSGWIKAVGYDKKSGTLALSMNGRHYGWPVSEDVAQQLRTSRSPGKVFNQLVKGKPRSEQLDACDNCGRVYSPKMDHRCPARHNAPESSAGVWDRLARAAARVRDGRPKK